MKVLTMNTPIYHPNPYALLWIIPETRGFSTLLSSMIHAYLGLVVACTYDMSLLHCIFWNYIYQVRNL